MVLEDAMSMNG